ncbi:MAG TPA: hypothetical protein VHH73_14180 [Verrucomicrobiae bacterium]|nr:hypothetical protein [Verrucomicrobiae bacterium]
MKLTSRNARSANLTSGLAYSCLASGRQMLANIEQTKSAVLAEFRGALAGHEQLLRLALNEAEALAWQTAYPHLVFPALAKEKVMAAAAWSSRQRKLLDRSPVMAFAE